jgi:lipoprotein-releasing system ATP-binding protein
MSELLVAKDIHRIYQDGKRKLYVLKGAALSLEAGDILIIQGPSGSGKSTLLHILGALDKPNKGEILLNGISVYKTDDAACSRIRNERIGFVFQFYHLLAEFNALENVMMPALIKIKNQNAKIKIKERAKELLDKVGLSGRITHKPSQLSGGEAQRVAIARALMNKPDLVLCDEPTGNLDYENSMSIFKLIKELNKQEQTSFIIVTHEREYAKLFNKVEYLQDGKLRN